MDVELADTVTANFNSGDFMMPIVLNYFEHSRWRVERRCKWW